MKIADRVFELLQPKVSSMGYLLDEVAFEKEQGNWVLTLYIEYEDGRRVTLEDCESVSRAVDPILDEADPIEQAYYLSVSSIGLDRPIKKPRDFERNLNRQVTVKLYAPLRGRKEYTGELIAYDGESFTILVKGKGDDQELKLAKKDAAGIRPYIDFNNLIVNAEENES